jgi:hypothetical protein
MASLSVFNQGRISKADLLQIAEQTLRTTSQPGAAGAAGAGLAAELDLCEVFKRLILRV